MSRADWGPWQVRTNGPDCDLHIRHGKNHTRVDGRVQVRVWADGRARVIAEGRRAEIAWFYLALGCAGQAARGGALGETGGDLADDGSNDPVWT